MQHNFNISQHPTEILHSSVSKYRILIAHHHTFSAFSAAFLKMTGIYNPTHKLSYLIYIYIYILYTTENTEFNYMYAFGILYPATEKVQKTGISTV